MSNEFVVLLAIFVSALGGGLTVLAWALAKRNEYLKAELSNAKENWVRNGQIAREYQVLAGKLEEERDDLHLFNHLLQQELKMAEDRNAFLETSSANGWEDAANKWQQAVDARNK